MCELDNVFVWACANVTLKSECAHKLQLIVAEFWISVQKPPINPVRMLPSSPLFRSSLHQNLLYISLFSSHSLSILRVQNHVSIQYSIEKFLQKCSKPERFPVTLL